ncbi:hypothetical protein CTI12_AA229780 [Artemisia annua]|uniref:Helitron helicase-like domain-containing protein n=1 Tax=Artemisia annua TaxID=35608 RepID=A0A2U1NUE9_ARTAN|nr:hypothetical protein CTI12_AA229780 [Artemisia annua]
MNQSILSSITQDVLQQDPYAFVYDGIPSEQRVLPACSVCIHCGAKSFKFEFPSFCCMGGKTKLAPHNIPEELYNLFTSQSDLGKRFRDNIRAYNTNFCFASMGVTLDQKYASMSSGVYTFRASGGIYHRIDQLVPRDGNPRYLQLYFYDSESELNHRLKWDNLDRNVVEILTRVLATNPYVRTFRSLGQLGPLDKYRVTLNASVELDQRVYNRPTTSEVAGIWVEGNDNITAYKRSIVVYGRSQCSENIQPSYACYDPMSYVLFFPNGEPGWHPKIPRDGVSIDEITNEDENMDHDLEESNSNHDYRRCCENVERVQNMVLRDISVFLQSMGKSLNDFDLPCITATSNLESAGYREQAMEDSAFANLLFVCCQHLRRVMNKHRIMMVDMEALGDRGVAVDSLEALRKTYNRHKAMLEIMTDLLAQARSGVSEEEGNAVKMNENN